MRQAIVTKWLGPTNHKGARVRATAQAGTVVVDWDHAEGVDANHSWAALELMRKLGWAGRLVGGEVPDGTGNAYVIVVSE